MRDEAARGTLEFSLVELDRLSCGCESILRSPIPLFYTQHSARFMTLWLGLLPLGLVTVLGWQAVPAEGVVAFVLLGLDEIAMQLEEPFGVLPLESMVRSVKGDLDTLVSCRKDDLGLLQSGEDRTIGRESPSAMLLRPIGNAEFRE